MTLTKAEIASTFHQQNRSISHRKALKMANVLVDLCGSVAVSDEVESVRIFRLGMFYSAEKRARIGRNPQNMKPAVVSARRVLKFRKSQFLMEAVECQLD